MSSQSWENGHMLLAYGTWWGHDVVFIHTVMLTGTASKDSTSSIKTYKKCYNINNIFYDILKRLSWTSNPLPKRCCSGTYCPSVMTFHILFTSCWPCWHMLTLGYAHFIYFTLFSYFYATFRLCCNFYPMVEAYNNVRIIMFYGKFKWMVIKMLNMSIFPHFPL